LIEEVATIAAENEETPTVTTTTVEGVESNLIPSTDDGTTSTTTTDTNTGTTSTTNSNTGTTNTVVITDTVNSQNVTMAYNTCLSLDNNISLCFDSVYSDSRCTQICIWQGDVIMDFTLKDPSTGDHPFRISTEEHNLTPGLFNDTIISGVYIRATNAYPISTAGYSPKNSEYSADIYIEQYIAN
jgi:hypothetical protein